MADFTFVTYEAGSIDQSLAIRKTVRSRAARANIPANRHAIRMGASNEGNAVICPDIATRLGQKRLLRPAHLRPGSSASTTVTTSSTNTKLDDGASQPRNDTSLPADRPAMAVVPFSGILIEPTHPVLRDQPWFSKRSSPLFTDFCLRCMAVDIPDLDQGRNGLLRSIWFPFAIVHDGLLEIIFLLSGSCYLTENADVEIQPSVVRQCLGNLKLKALANIRRSIMDNTASISDQSIAAVTKMASYEAMYGSHEVFAMHMKALRRLFDLRGGLPNLGLEGLLERMVCWVDYNSACLLQSKPYFPEGSTLPKPVAFDPQAFIGGSK